MSYADDIIFTGALMLLIACGIFHQGIRHAYDRWVEHRDHVADTKRDAQMHRMDLLYGQAPEKRQNSTVAE